MLYYDIVSHTDIAVDSIDKHLNFFRLCWAVENIENEKERKIFESVVVESILSVMQLILLDKTLSNLHASVPLASH